MTYTWIVNSRRDRDKSSTFYFSAVFERGDTLEEFRIKTDEALQTINPNMLFNVQIGFYNRIGFSFPEEH